MKGVTIFQSIWLQRKVALSWKNTAAGRSGRGDEKRVPERVAPTIKSGALELGRSRRKCRRRSPIGGRDVVGRMKWDE